MESHLLATTLQKILDDKKAEDIQLLDLRGRSNIADFFILATGLSSTHVAALAEEMDRFASQQKIQVLGIEGLPLADWVLIDMEDVIIHLFRANVREFYNLEKLWHPTTAMIAAGRG
ncbi:MAG: ribosome silencing factor [Magnetococcales bacterium]|nr:ribosome silencing factor [Magnetococcales bacterium]